MYSSIDHTWFGVLNGILCTSCVWVALFVGWVGLERASWTAPLALPSHIVNPSRICLLVLLFYIVRSVDSLVSELSREPLILINAVNFLFFTRRQLFGPPFYLHWCLIAGVHCSLFQMFRLDAEYPMQHRSSRCRSGHVSFYVWIMGNQTMLS